MYIRYKTGCIKVIDGVLIINLTKEDDSNIVINYSEPNGISVTYDKGQWLFCVQSIFADITPSGFVHDGSSFKNIIEHVRDEYIETTPAYNKKYFFGLFEKEIPEQKIVKEGWIRLKKDIPKEIKTSNYRIIYK